jgi:hypothetical protein
MSSQVIWNYDPAFQKELRGKIEDLAQALKLANDPFNAWEREFVVSIIDRLKEDKIRVTEKQYQHIFRIWDKV